MFDGPNNPSSTMSGYAYFIVAVDAAARADARAKERQSEKVKPARQELPRGRALLHWIRDIAEPAVLLPRRWMT
ncbi:MAG: hypothetical protein ACYSTY_10785 [Planctomycetota bacterium]|jgi:hypothetical protein